MSPKKKPKANVQEILNNPVRSTKQKGVKPKREGFLGWMTYLGWSMMVWAILLLGLSIFDFASDYEVQLPSPFSFLYLSLSLFNSALLFSVIAMLLFAKIWLNSSYRQSISFIERTLLAGVTVFVVSVFIFGAFVNFDDAFALGIGGKEGIRFLICYSWLLGVVIFRMMIKIRWTQFFKLYGIGVILSFVFVLVSVECEMCLDYIVFGLPGLYVVYWIYAIGSYLYIFYKKSKDGYNKVWLKVFLFTLLPFLFLFSVRFKLNIPYEPGVMGDVLYEP